MSLPAPRPDSTILITGASSGIGTEFARQLAARGHNVTLVARREERLTAIAEELRLSHGIRADVHAADLGDDSARGAMLAKLLEGEFVVTGAINNAGYGSFGRFWELPLDREVAMVRLNCDALTEITGACLADMVRRGEGAVLNLSSVAASQPFPLNATYSATKAFVSSFTEAVSAELAGTGVSCTALCPGPVATEFGEEAGAGEAESNLPGFLVQQPDEVARAGIEAMVKGKRTVFSGIGPRIAGFSGRFTPRSALLPVVNRVAGRQFGGDRS